MINGVKQYVSISPVDSSNKKPVILFLHGGPGSANMSLIHSLCPKIEEYATVVNWDQRGAGKSFNLFASKKHLTVDQFVNDAHVLTQLLKKLFETEQIILLGFSWGTVLGMLLCSKYPQDYTCFISIAQLVHGLEGEQMSLDFVKKEARRRNDVFPIKKFDKVVCSSSDPEEFYKQTLIERKYLLKYGGIYTTKNSYSHEVSSIWISKEYSFIDFCLWPIGSIRSLKSMWYEVVNINLKKLVPTVSVPVVFMSGVYDMNDPFSLAKQYYESIEAPAGKEFVVFKKSAHSIFWDEPQALEREIIAVITRYCQ
jgi:pimeloyl-ACP methyl ester carboxylesterase